jgi:uncharacterized protein (DUF305 family)
MRLTSRITALTAAAVAATLLLAGCGSSSTSGETPASPAAASGAVAAAGSEADITFAQLMIPHHEQAVQMADMALQQASSQEVIDLATQIKGAQDPEIAQMRGWLEQWGAPEQMDGADGMDHGGMDMGGQTTAGMMSDQDMGALMDASGPEFDQMWLAMMIAHHKGAIEMAEQVRAESTNPEVTALADAIVAGQTTEIDTMQQLLEQ